jgi:hypothetical protein
MWRQSQNIGSNKNVDIKCNAHDAFLEYHFIRYSQKRKIGKPHNLKSV